MCYMNSSAHFKLVAKIGDPPGKMRLLLFVDADFRGDIEHVSVYVCKRKSYTCLLFFTVFFFFLTVFFFSHCVLFFTVFFFSHCVLGHPMRLHPCLGLLRSSDRL